MTTLIVWLASNIVRPLVEWFAHVFIFPVLEFVLGLGKKIITWWWAIAVLIAGYLSEEGFRIGKAVFKWVVEKVWELWGVGIDFVVDALPEDSQPNMELIENLVNAANAWVPLDLVVTLSTSWFAFQLTWAAWFIVKRHIPTMGK